MTASVKTFLVPFPQYAVIISILTARELTKKEEKIVCEAYQKHATPFAPIKNLQLLVDELKSQGYYSLANEIIT